MKRVGIMLGVILLSSPFGSAFSTTAKSHQRHGRGLQRKLSLQKTRERIRHSHGLAPDVRTSSLQPLSMMHPPTMDEITGPLQFMSSTFPTFSLAEGSEAAMLDVLGKDIFTFLVASVVVVPLSKILKISPVLGFLAVGCALGPYGMQLFSNAEADIELGDFGILFLLFNEGLSLSPERIKALSRFSGLGFLQLVGSIGLFFAGTIIGGPLILKYVTMAGIPLDERLLRPILGNPVEAFCIAAAGALSSSAFVLPVLKEKKWEDRPEGVAGLSVLLLQDLAVAPLLVIIPLLAGSGPQSSTELGILVAKATVGFGAVLVAGSYILRYVFDVVAAARSTETFVAATLLVAIGMGQAADLLGLSSSTGAFAAGVLLAGNRYRAQIQADIKPFEGILLGIFFMSAGANLDPAVVLAEWPTLFTGIAAFIATKAGIIFLEGPALGLTRAEAARVALTLAGGGEFAFILFSLAQSLGVLPSNLAKLLTASVIISMSLTPLLGEVGAFAGDLLESMDKPKRATLSEEEANDLFDEIDEDGSGTIELPELRATLKKKGFRYAFIAEIFAAFDADDNGEISRKEWKDGLDSGLLADALAIEDVEDSDLAFEEDAIVICGYGELGKSLYDVLRASGGEEAEDGRIAIFDLNPARCTAGALEEHPVVFGDAAKFDLLKATGITNPSAVVITFASNSRRMAATMRLRSSLPVDTPIFVTAGNNAFAQKLLDAGATDVIVETTESVLRFTNLLGFACSREEMNVIRKQKIVELVATEVGQDAEDSPETIPGLSELAMFDLASELGCSRRELYELYEEFDSVAGDRDFAPIDELKEVVLRVGQDGPSDGQDLSKYMKLEDEDGRGDLTFIEFARAAWRGTHKEQKDEEDDGEEEE